MPTITEDKLAGESNSISNQKDILLRYAKKNHFFNPEFYVDDGFSGTNFDKPGFQKILDDISDGKVETVITKDLSRLGRNSAMVGMFTNITLAKYGVRYIAINDNYDTIDPNSIDNDFAGIKNWFNEFFARDTSRKIRAVYRAKGERGETITNNVPFGYIKDPNDPKKWIVDEEAAEVVRKVFALCMEGRGPLQIARQLTAEGVPTITSYRAANGLSVLNNQSMVSNKWNSSSVANILERREYTGCIVNFKTYTNSIWDKKKHINDDENILVFPNSHEAIIDYETFEKVQDIRKQRHRRTRTGKTSMFSGLVFCHDCGARMYYCVHRNNQDNFICSNSRENKTICTAHYIREVVLEKLVWSHMSRVIDMVIHYEDYFRSYMKEQLHVQTQESIKALSKRLVKAQNRLEELNRLYIKVYEDNATGKISDDKFSMIATSYEYEQRELEPSITTLQTEIESQKNKIKDLEKFIKRVNQHIGLKELNAYVLHELIKGIYVEAPDKSSGQRVQKIHIKYDLVGFIPVDELLRERMV